MKCHDDSKLKCKTCSKTLPSLRKYCIRVDRQFLHRNVNHVNGHGVRTYRQTSYTIRTKVGNKIVVHSDVVGAASYYYLLYFDFLVQYCGNSSASRTGVTADLRWIIHVHDDVIKWKHFPHYWPFVRGIHPSPVNSPHKGQWRGALMFSLICAWISGWVNNRQAGDSRRHCAHYDVSVMVLPGALKIHNYTHRKGRDTSMWTCDRCHKSLSGQAALMRHKARCTGGGKPKRLRCRKCSYSCYTKVYFRDHMRLRHGVIPEDQERHIVDVIPTLPMKSRQQVRVAF